jgi:hypothetical protein
LDIGVDFAWCQSRFRLMPKPRFEARTKAKAKPVAAPKEKQKVR